MKIAEALARVESPILIKLRDFIGSAAADSVYTADELAEALGASKTSIRDFCQRAEFFPHRVRKGHRFFYGSLKGVYAFRRAQRKVAHEN